MMSAIVRPSHILATPGGASGTSSSAKQGGRSHVVVVRAGKKSGGADAASSSSAPSSTATSLALKGIAAATAVGLCVLAIPNSDAIAAVSGASSSASTSVFVGEYADPKHPGCLRAIEGSSAGESASTLAVKGTDGTPGCANGEKQRPWSLTGDIVKIPSKADEILIDFSPKGGPKNLLGKWTGTGILFPDGNEWKKLQ